MLLAVHAAWRRAYQSRQSVAPEPADSRYVSHEGDRDTPSRTPRYSPYLIR